MAWLTSVTETNTIVITSRKYTERIFWQGSGYVNKRAVEITTTHYVGLTKAAADSYVSSHSGDTGVQDMYAERVGDGGEYRVVANVVTVGAWEYDAEWTEEGPPA